MSKFSALTKFSSLLGIVSSLTYISIDANLWISFYFFQEGSKSEPISTTTIKEFTQILTSTLEKLDNKSTTYSPNTIEPLVSSISPRKSECQKAITVIDGIQKTSFFRPNLKKGAILPYTETANYKAVVTRFDDCKVGFEWKIIKRPVIAPSYFSQNMTVRYKYLGKDYFSENSIKEAIKNQLGWAK